MADNFGLKIGVEGEKEFKSALYSINQSFRVLGSEMKLVESQFSKNDTSIQSLIARNQVLNKEIDTQKAKIELLKNALTLQKYVLAIGQYQCKYCMMGRQIE